MLRKILLLVLIFFNSVLLAKAQNNVAVPAGKMKPAFQRLLLELATTYFTVVKENQVDLDSSLIHVSKVLSLSRLPIIAAGIVDKGILNSAYWVDQRKPGIGKKNLGLPPEKSRQRFLYYWVHTLHLNREMIVSLTIKPSNTWLQV
jgi:hypothetical protein